MLSIVMPLAELAEMKNGLQFYSGNFNEKKTKTQRYLPSIKIFKCSVKNISTKKIFKNIEKN